MHTTCVVCINLASKKLALVNLVKIMQNLRIFMGMQAKDMSIFVLIWKASFLLAISRI